MPWSKIYPKANPAALSLVDKMLTFNPNKRWSVEQCLGHAYFSELHNPDDEPTAPIPFDWSTDDFTLTKEIL
jgi:mitogen-activated protein kinase 1/3